MPEMDWKSRAEEESGKIIDENFGNPFLPSLLWLLGYKAGMIETVNDFRQTSTVVSAEIEGVTSTE